MMFGPAFARAEARAYYAYGKNGRKRPSVQRWHSRRGTESAFTIQAKRTEFFGSRRIVVAAMEAAPTSFSVPLKVET